MTTAVIVSLVISFGVIVYLLESNIRLRRTINAAKIQPQILHKAGYIHGLEAAAATVNTYGEKGGIARLLRAIRDEKVYLESLKE